MPPGTNDYKLVSRYADADGFDIQNVWYFQYNSGTKTAQALHSAFDTVLTPLITDCLHASAVIQPHTVINLADTSDFYEATPINATGGQGGSHLPSFVTATIVFQRSDRTVRNGRKSLSPLAESSISGSSLASLYITNALQPLINQINVGLINGADDFSFMIPKFVNTGQTYPSGNPIYELDSLVPIQAASIGGVGTQTSRKRGSGS